MKLKLKSENDIQVLEVSELNAPKNVDVLKAGITRLFKNGKNKIILELLEPKSVSQDILRELGKFKLLANELSGDIVLSGLDPDNKQRIDAFSKPPMTLTFATTEQALKYFKELSAPATAVNPAAVTSPMPAPAASGAAATPASGAAQIQAQFKEELRQREMGEVGALRKEVEALRRENEALLTTIAQKMIDRREPPDVAAYKEKILALETQLADLLAEPPKK